MVCLDLPGGWTFPLSLTFTLVLLEQTYLWKDMWVFLTHKDPFLLRRAADFINIVWEYIDCGNEA